MTPPSNFQDIPRHSQCKTRRGTKLFKVQGGPAYGGYKTTGVLSLGRGLQT